MEEYRPELFNALLEIFPHINLKTSNFALSCHAQEHNVETSFSHFPCPSSPEPCLLILSPCSRRNKELYSSLCEIGPVSQLWVVGETNRGVKSFAKQFNCQSHAVGGGGRILAPLQEPPTALCREYAHTSYSFLGRSIEVVTCPGLFSHGKVDRGTQLLLSVLEDITLTGKYVLDLGCGSGVLSRAALIKNAASVWATDISAVALDMTQKNVSPHSAAMTTSPSTMGNTIDTTFTVILTNPPFHTGKTCVHTMAAPWMRAVKRLLDLEGTAYVVANSFLPYEEYALQYFTTCSIVRKEAGFTVYEIRGHREGRTKEFTSATSCFVP